MAFAAVIGHPMEGAIDFHVHAGPDPFSERRLDALELARQSEKYGMRAVMAKNHQFGTASLAQLANRIVPRFSVIGSLTLKREVGGINIDGVKASFIAGAKVVWMPTTSDVDHNYKKPIQTLLDKEKQLLPEAISMLEFGYSEREIKHLIKINPARILGLAEIERS
jgi:hypothetical protein